MTWLHTLEQMAFYSAVMLLFVYLARANEKHWKEKKEKVRGEYRERIEKDGNKNIYYHLKTGTSLCEVLSSDGLTPLANIDVHGPDLIHIEKSSRTDATISLQIPAKMMDEISIAWCKHRNLIGTTGGPVENETSSPA